MIRETKVEGRRRSYILTDKGREMLKKECARLTAQLAESFSISALHSEAKLIDMSAKSDYNIPYDP